MSYTHLRVGTKPFRSKPPRKGPPCTEPYVTGTNILTHPGVETQLSAVGGGPNADEIPHFGGNWASAPFPMEWTDGSEAPDRLTWASEEYYSTQDVEWMVSTASPRSGTYHLRNAAKNGTATTYTQYRLFWLQQPLCNGSDFASAFVEPGDFIRFGVYAKANTVTNTPYIRLEWYAYNAAGTALGGVASEDLGSGTGELEITASYAWYEISGFAPANARYIWAWLWFATATSPNHIYDVDDAVLEVT